MLACEVLKLISGALQDLEPDCEKRIAWEPDGERVNLLDYLNEAMRQIALERPDAFAVTEVIRLEPGMRQALPDPKRHECRRKASILIELVRNMGSCGTCPGEMILPCDPALIMAWARACQEGSVIENYGIDRVANPRSYLVYPPVSPKKPVYVEAVFGVSPCKVVSPEQELCVEEKYAPALTHHVLAQIFSGDSELSQLEKANWHTQMYQNIMAGKLSVDSVWPKRSSS